MYAIVGGSGLAKLQTLQKPRGQVMRTPYGETSGALTFGEIAGARGGLSGAPWLWPHAGPARDHYRANIWALKELKVDGVIAVAPSEAFTLTASRVTGAAASDHRLQHSRKSTFFEGSEMPVIHVDFTQPYHSRCELALSRPPRRATARQGRRRLRMHTGTAARDCRRIERIAREGGDIVGMTGMPEAVLARESELEYASLAVVVNHAAGRGDSLQAIRLEELGSVMQATITRAVRILSAFFGAAP